MRNPVEVSTIQRLMPIPVILPLVVLVLAATIGVLVIALGGCGRKEPIRIGFSEQLTRPQSDLGVQGRDGAELAVEKINASGGINGRPIELIIRDDKGTAEGVNTTDHELIKSGVVAIIGHASSQQTKEALPIINAEHVVLISPTATADGLTKVGGYFFRVISTNRIFSTGLARSIVRRYGTKTMVVIRDTDNAASTESFLKNFGAEFESLGGKVVEVATFSSRGKPNFTALLQKLREKNPEGLLIITNSVDAALIAQRTRLLGWKVPMFSSGLAESGTLIKLGGKAVEGLEKVVHYDLNSRSPAFLDFKNNYRSKYGEDPTEYSALGYETVEVLADALRKTDGRREGLREALLETKNFKGLVSTFSLDKSGSAVRPSYVVVIRNSKAVTVDVTEPSTQEGK
jgi:branched-chain amino acid transport system substrate-binding protein